jgi:3-oxoacyl-[acyl-carrier protein] reductase
MRIKFFGSYYVIVLWHRLIPKGIRKIVSSFNGEPNNTNLSFNGYTLNGKVALVTGAHKGIGKAIALKLLQEGANVIITGRNENALKKVVNDLNGQISYQVWDISNTMIANSMFEIAEKKYGKIDILVNNAGVTTDRAGRIDFDTMDKTHFHYVHDINSIGTKVMCEIFASRVDNGTILNIISNTSIRPAQDAYFTSKWAIYSFTKTFGAECKKKGKDVTVNGLCPGPIKTDMSFDENTSLFRPEIPAQRMGLPEEMAELAFLQILSGLNGIDAQITICDGGETLN